MKRPEDIVYPAEIIAFLEKQQISEEAATGIKLLRRAAESIAFWLDEINRLKDPEWKDGAIVPDTANTADNILDQDLPNDLDQIALSLGAEGASLDQILDKISEKDDERNRYITAIQQRDAVIEQTEYTTASHIKYKAGKRWINLK